MDSQVLAETTQSSKTKPFRLLFVDDEKAILSSLKRLMRRQDYDCYFAEDAQEGLAILEQEHIDLIVSDMRMPGMDGAAFLTEVKQRWPFSVRFLMTGFADMQATINALNHGGIHRYISKPWDEDGLLEAIQEGLRIIRLEREKKRLLDTTRRQNRELKQFNEELEQRVQERTQEIEHKSALVKKAFQQLENSYDAFVRVFSTVINSRPQLQKGQSRQVADVARALARQQGLDRAQVAYIYYAGLLHEIGKLNLPDDLLSRAEVHLTHRDRPIYRQYPEMGEMYLTAITALAPTSRLIRHHMEAWNGSGFPDGLRGEAIDIGARILRVACDFVGLQSGLMAEEPLTKEQALAHIERHAGQRYDPEIASQLQSISDSLVMAMPGANEAVCTAIELQPGMTLTRDLVNRSGILLLSSGTTVNKHIINKLLQIESLESHKVTVYVSKQTAEGV
ncbi:MAG: response regulator [Pseudomonadales bacterium]|nr:response regulator [Pseudomonadales bacterium]